MIWTRLLRQAWAGTACCSWPHAKSSQTPAEALRGCRRRAAALACTGAQAMQAVRMRLDPCHAGMARMDAEGSSKEASAEAQAMHAVWLRRSPEP